ncbi:MAG: hypothetical protein H7Z14_16680 [Anaerolineae bacterium]|nr:hypothetical protein [Phycisphaerae bacterium]
MDAVIAAPVTSCAPMRPWRIWLVATLAGVLIVGHLFDIVTQVEHWPFSFYPMYGRVQKKTRLQVLSLYGVMQQGKRAKGERITSSAFVPQLGEARLRNILIASWGRDGSLPRAKRDTAAILRDYLKLYESRRLAGLHDGKPMIEAQLVQITWVVKGDNTSKRARSVVALIGVRADGRVIDYRKTAPTTGASGEQDKDEVDGE